MSGKKVRAKKNSASAGTEFKQEADINMLRKISLTALIFMLWNVVWVTPAAAQGSDRVIFGELKTYTHEGNLFAIDYPSNWQKLDISEGAVGTMAAIAFVDKTNSASLNVEITDPGTKTFAPQIFFAGFHNLYKQRFYQYSSGVPREVGSDKWTLSFEFKRSMKLIQGNAFVEWNGEYVSVITVLIPKDQYAKNRNIVASLVNSFEMNPGSSTYGTLALEQYEHPEGAFLIDYPEGWQIEDLSDVSEDGRIIVQISQPYGLGGVRVEMLAWKKKATIDWMGQMVETETNRLYGEHLGYSAYPVRDFGKNSVGRVFSYVVQDQDGENVSMVGAMVMQRHDGMLSYLQVVMPKNMEGVDAELIENIMDSLRIDVDAAGEILN